MKYRNIHLIYFSPTHTSAKIAYAIAEEMKAETMSESDVTYKPLETIESIDDELTIIVAPTYGGRVSETAMERFRMFKANQAPAIPVVLYGNRDYEDALRELCDLATEQGFIPIAAGAFVGEHSFSRRGMPIAEGRPDEEDFKQAAQLAKEVLCKLEAYDNPEEIPALKVKGNIPYKIKSPSTPQAPVMNEELCTECQYCVDTCPTQAISLTKDGMFSDPALCIKCCACVKECPEGARSFDTPYTAILHKNCSARRAPEWFI